MNSHRPILVTGATGCIGSVLIRRLCALGQSVRAVVRNPAKADALKGIGNVEVFRGDLSQPNSLRGCAEGCSLCYHLAAKLTSTDWASSYATNVAGTQAVLEEAMRAGIERLVYTSTVGVYGFSKQEVLTEETPWSPGNLPYVKTKQEAERIVWKAVDRLPITIARVGDVMGPGQETWTLDLIRKCKKDMLAVPLDSESGFLNPIYIDNLVDALVLMGTHPAAPRQVFNVVDGTPIRANDYYRRTAQMAGKKVPALPVVVIKALSALLMGYDILRGREPSAIPGFVNYVLRKGKIYPRKIQSLLGWVPAIAQADAFCRTEQWLRQEGYVDAA